MKYPVAYLPCLIENNIFSSSFRTNGTVFHILVTCENGQSKKLHLFKYSFYFLKPKQYLAVKKYFKKSKFGLFFHFGYGNSRSVGSISLFFLPVKNLISFIVSYKKCEYFKSAFKINANISYWLKLTC